MRSLSPDEYRRQLLVAADFSAEEVVRNILRNVRKQGDEAIRELTRRFDGIDVKEFKVTESEIKRSVQTLDPDLRKAIISSAQRVRTFAQRQLAQVADQTIEIEPGVMCGQVVSPIERTGVYVPGGRYALVSSVIMGIVPAQVAGVKETCVCSPPGKDGKINKAILGAAGLLEIKEIYCIGGAQAIAAMAYGTETVKRVDMIVGPGNKYVTLAKKAVYGEVGIDFIAGPTEVMIIADDSANPELIAADLLAQAEHDVEALPILVTKSRRLLKRVEAELENQLRNLGSAQTARIALAKNAVCIITDRTDEAINIANERAPEHLELQVKSPEKLTRKLKHYGSLFIGDYAAEVLGDYSSGLNHTLPTNRAARYTGGLSVLDFVRLQTTLRVDKKGFEKIAADAETIARAEGLNGHVNAIEMRRRK